ncbi:hypothetical protein TNCV_1629201 [Trichonephila clavipes]|uniref:Uncharacterized protein n=1 Tax=Trichonephila clavipes TaxID=2585209 RepID=A0A8X7BGM1_TRICX|nr:hypothetical protein TNCV_1629201 [Trichonephila clavipes]
MGGRGYHRRIQICIATHGRKRLRLALGGVVHKNIGRNRPVLPQSFELSSPTEQTATAGSDVVQSGRPVFDDFFQHLWPYIGNNTANVVFQMVKRLWLIRIDQ